MNIQNPVNRMFPTGLDCVALTVPNSTTQAPRVDEVANNDDACVSLLAEVDFKWLMAGQGWWIDPSRFRCDASYAESLLRFALSSPSFALRASAASLQTQSCGAV